MNEPNLPFFQIGSPDFPDLKPGDWIKTEFVTMILPRTKNYIFVSKSSPGDKNHPYITVRPVYLKKELPAGLKLFEYKIRDTNIRKLTPEEVADLIFQRITQ